MTEEQLRAPHPAKPDYSYRCKVVRVVDGDTIDVDIDLGFAITARKRLRLYGVNTWETRGAERPRGLLAKEYVETLLLSVKEVWVQTLMDAEGKYGRLLAWVWVLVEGDFPGYVCLNTELLRLGHGREYMVNKT
jgi:endonuclease YncB( thermonuclease family)